MSGWYEGPVFGTDWEPDGTAVGLQKAQYRELAERHRLGVYPYDVEHCGGDALLYEAGHPVYDYIEAKYNSGGVA